MALITAVVTYKVTRKPEEHKDAKDTEDTKPEKRASVSSADPEAKPENRDSTAQAEELPNDDSAETEEPGRGQAVAGLTKEWGVLEGLLGAAGTFKKFFVILFRVLGVSLIVAYVLGTAYADWMIGVAAANIPGVPHERVLGGVYFAAKHLSMLIF